MKTYQVEVELKATVLILAESEEQAKYEAEMVVSTTRLDAASRGLSLETRGIKPRHVVAYREVP